MARRIRDWPEEDRPREKLFERGPGALSDSELLALVLRTGSARSGETALDQARRLLAAHGLGLARLPAGALRREAGIGPAKAAAIAAALELGRRFSGRPRANGSGFRTAADVFAHVRGRLAALCHEEFLVLLLDAKHRKLREVRVSQGSLTAAIVHPREVFAPAIHEAAAAVILVHNHPSGDPSPSPEDLSLTRRLREAGTILGIEVLDHVIVGANAYYSFAEAGR